MIKILVMLVEIGGTHSIPPRVAVFQDMATCERARGEIAAVQRWRSYACWETVSIERVEP